MLSAPAAPDLRLLAPDFARRFAVITAGLIALIARVFLKNPRLAPRIIPLYRHLTFAAARCNALMAMLAAGRMPRRRKPASRRGNEPADQPPAPRPPVVRLPATPAFLIKILADQAASYRAELADLLAQPGVAALLAAAPTASHFLRPLCRLLGLPPPTIPATQPQSAATPIAPPPPRTFATNLPWIIGPLPKRA